MKTDPYLTQEQAAKVAGMSRIAFRKHIGKGIKPDMVVGAGKRGLFLRSTVMQWRRERERNGIKKRGPQSRNGNKKSTSRKDT